MSSASKTTTNSKTEIPIEIPNEEGPIITIISLTNKTKNIPFSEADSTVVMLKEVIMKSFKLNGEPIILIRDGKVLIDTDIVKEGSTIFLFHYDVEGLLLDPIETAADWEVKNKLKLFKGLYLLSKKRFTEATPLLIGALTTFNDFGFISFPDLVKYCLVSGMLTLSRTEILENLIKSSEVLEVIEGLPNLKTLVESFYYCKYQSIFPSLLMIHDDLLSDFLLREHVSFFVKEMRVRSYVQALKPYSSLSLKSLSENFNVSLNFIDRYFIYSLFFFANL